MPKKSGNIYSDIIDIDNIKRAHLNAKKDKSFYSAVVKTSNNLDERSQKIHKMLKNHTYQVSPYKTSLIQDKNKKRILFKLPYYPDRIIQWAIMLQIEPIFRKTMTDFTCASIPGRGIHQASELVDKWINSDPKRTKYCLKLDIKKFYPSINRKILKKLLRRKFKDKDLLIELDKIIDSMDNCDISKIDLPQEEKELYLRPGKGIPVGSYLSQYLANYYLTFFDHWLKEVLHCPYVVRYMDDIVIFGETKKQLREWLFLIKEYLSSELDLEIKSNYQIFPVDARGVDFVGYRHFRGYKLLRKTTLKTFKQTAIKMQKYNQEYKLPTDKEWCAWVSSLGWIQWCDSKHFYKKYYEDSIPIVNTYYSLYKKSKYKKASYQFMTPNRKKINNKKYYNKNWHNIIHKKGG